MMKNRLYRKSVTLKWFISYFLLLIIPLFVSLGVYIKMEQTVKTEIEHSNKLVLSQIKTELDNIFDVQKRISTELAFDSDLNELIGAKTPQEQWRLKQKVFSSVKTRIMSNSDFVDDVYVYFIDSDIVVMPNSITDSKTFYQMHFDWREGGYENWRSFVTERRNDQFVLMPCARTNTGAEHEVAFFRNLPLSTRPYVGTQVVIATVFWESRLNDIAERIKQTNSGELIILDENNRVFFTSSEKTVEKLNVESINQSHGDVFNSGVRSDVNRWQYVISVKKNDYWGQLIFVRILMVLYVVFTLLVGGMMSKIFVKQNYAPVMRLMSKLKMNGERGGYDEFAVIFDGISEIIDERNLANSQVRDKENSLRNYFFSKLLNGKFADRTVAEKYGKDFSVTFPHDNFVVVLFRADDIDALFSDDDDLDTERKNEYYQLIITNIMEELLNAHYCSYLFNMEGIMAALISIPPKEAEKTVDDICEILSEGVSLVEKYFSITLGAVVSNSREGFGKIRESYYEAYDALQSLEIEKIDAVAKCADICAPSPWHNRTETEIYLSNYIKTGDSEKAVGMIKDVIRQNGGAAYAHTELIRCIMYNLLGVMCRAAGEVGGQIDFSRDEYLNSLLHCESVEKIREVMTDAVTSLCACVSETASDDSGVEQKVKQLVRENFRKQGFGVMEIGEHFGLTPSYISRLFKRETGELLTDYITRVRIDEAKRLIRETKDTFDHIAEQVGYLNAKILARTFKKTEGILPSQYRAMHNEK